MCQKHFKLSFNFPFFKGRVGQHKKSQHCFNSHTRLEFSLQTTEDKWMEKALLKWLRTPLGLQLQFFYLTLKLLRVEVLYLNCLYMFIQQKVLHCLYLLIIYIKEKELGISFCACRLCSNLVDSYIRCFFFYATNAIWLWFKTLTPDWWFGL